MDGMKMMKVQQLVKEIQFQQQKQNHKLFSGLFNSMDCDDIKNSTAHIKSLGTFDNLDIDPYSAFTVMNTQRDSMVTENFMLPRKSDASSNNPASSKS